MAKDEINAFLGPGSTYQGRLDFAGTVRIDGSFEGEIESEGTLVVGRGATVSGKVRVGRLVMSGTVSGEVVAGEGATLRKSARFTGTLATKVLAVEEGALVDGQIGMISAAGFGLES